MIDIEVEVLWIARYDYQPSWKLKKHTHDFYQMIYIVDGDGTFFINKKEFSIGRGQLYFIKPEILHGLIPGKESSLKTLDIKFYVYNKALVKKLDKFSEEFQVSDGKLRNIFEAIRKEGTEKNSFYKEFINLYLAQMLLTLIRINSECQASHHESEDLVLNSTNFFSSKIIDYIKENYNKNLTLDKIASELGYNKTYLCENFKKTQNQTLFNFLYLYRISKAKELIKYSDYSLKEISALTGFESIHHFTRLFKQHENYTPGQWRNLEKAGIRKDIYINEAYINVNHTNR
jgi:AraC-like DNA-binding protein